MTKKILIVEDNKKTRNLYSALGRMIEVDTIQAQNDNKIVRNMSENARKLLKQENFSFALIDQDSPDSKLVAIVANEVKVPFGITYITEPKVDDFIKYNPVGFYKKSEGFQIKHLMRSWGKGQPLMNCFDCPGDLEACSVYASYKNVSPSCPYKIVSENDLEKFEAGENCITLVTMLQEHLKNDSVKLKKLEKLIVTLKSIK